MRSFAAAITIALSAAAFAAPSALAQTQAPQAEVILESGAGLVAQCPAGLRLNVPAGAVVAVMRDGEATITCQYGRTQRETQTITGAMTVGIALMVAFGLWVLLRPRPLLP